MLFRVFTILLLLFASSLYASAQYTSIEDAKFENYTPRNGLPSDFIETITQDKYGFIWLGTHNGLLRFDGMQFKIYLQSGADNNSLPDNDARSIRGDSTGKLWITSRKGLFYYNYAQDNFIKITAPVNGQLIQFASCPVTDRQNHLWFYSNAGICRMDCKTLAVTVLQISGITDFSYSVNRLFSTRQGNIWFCTHNDLYYFDTTLNAFQKQVITNYDGLLLKEGIQDIFEESKNKIWIASLFGLYLLNTQEKTIQAYPYHIGHKSDKAIYISGFSYCPKLTGDSILWCSTPYEGQALFNLRTGKFIKSYLQDNYDASSIGGSLCYNSFTDRDGILWISHINGLSKLDWHNQQIKSYRIKEMADSNRMVPIRKIIPDRKSAENYWLITWGYGILYYNKNANRVTRYYRQTRDTKNNSILFNYDGLYDDRGTLWIGSGIGLCYYDPRPDKFIHIKPARPGQKTDTTVLRMLKDRNNNLWLGAVNGLWKFSIPQNKFKKYVAGQGTDSITANSSVYAMHFGQGDKLYVGTQRGLYVLDTVSGQITFMTRPVGNNKTDFNINYIWGIAADADNNLWVTTRGGGLYKFNTAGKTYTDYKRGNGLTTEELRDVFVDSLQNVWISSFEGVFKLDRKAKSFTRYTPEDGLDNFNISLGRWNIINNKIYSGSPGAYSIIDPYARKSLTGRFPVWITGIRVVNRFIHFNPDSSEKITVPVNYTENIISFEFTAICYTASAKVKYAYLLEGFDKDWHFCENQRFASYNNLRGGRYTFKVKAMNSEGLWSDTIAYVNIDVKPAFWETWWFSLAVMIVFAGLITFLVKKRIANIRKKAGYKQQRAVFRQKLAEAEMIALRAQMNPHFIFNCMNIIDGLITDNRSEEAKDFLQKFSKLVRLVLENSQHQLVPLGNDLRALQLYTEMEAIRYNHRFSYEFNIAPELLDEMYKIPPLLLQPYVENAIIHGLRHKEEGRGKLSVTMKSEAGKISVTIEDNGVGRMASARINKENSRSHQQMGMNVTGKRIDLLKIMNPAKIGLTITDLQQGNETGTRVCITLPVEFNVE